MERVQALSAGASEGEAVVGRTDQDEERGSEDGLGVLTALGVAAPLALVMFVPELPVTSTILAKIRGFSDRSWTGGAWSPDRSDGRKWRASVSG